MFVSFVGILLAVGTLMVYSSSFTARPSDEEEIYLSRHLMSLLFAGTAGIIASQIPARIWKALAPVLFGGTLLMLVLVLIPGLGRTVNGSQRWFRIAGISLQPSETAKLTLPLMLCTMRFRRPVPSRPDARTLLLESALTGVTMILIALEPDLGTALFVGLAGGLTMWLCGCPRRLFLGAAALVVPAVGMMLVLQPYQLARIQGFIATWTNPDEAPYQIRQSLTTLGVGGWNGVGLGRGWQKLSFLPEANTDFVFAVVGEELGFVGTAGIVLVWGAVYFIGMRLIRRVQAFSCEAICASVLLIQLVVQAGVNIAVVTALLPPKGISHPFISYGGSNLAVNLVAIGVIFSMTRLPERPDMEDNTSVSEGDSCEMAAALASPSSIV